MAEDVATLEQQLATLRDVRARGHRSYSISTGTGSRAITFRDDDELAKAIADLERRIAAAKGGRRRFVKFQIDRGL